MDLTKDFKSVLSMNLDPFTQRRVQQALDLWQLDAKPEAVKVLRSLTERLDTPLNAMSDAALAVSALYARASGLLRGVRFDWKK